MGETKLKCKIFKTFYNLTIMVVLVLLLELLNMLPFIQELSTINSGGFIDVFLNSIITVTATTILVYASVTLYINWYKFVNYKPEPTPTGRALVSNGSVTPKRCSIFNIFC